MCDIMRCVIKELHCNLNKIVFNHQIFAADIFKFCPAPRQIDLIIHVNSLLADDSHEMPLNYFPQKSRKISQYMGLDGRKPVFKGL